MKRNAVVSTLALVTALVGSLSTAATADSGPREEREIKLLERQGAEYSTLENAGRILGEDGRGVFVYTQFRPCGKGTWRNLWRETTTERGVYAFVDMHRPVVKRKYRLKEYKVEFHDSNQFRLYIPATETYKPVRIPGDYCLG